MAKLETLRSYIMRPIHKVVNLALPPRCAYCGGQLAIDEDATLISNGALCYACWSLMPGRATHRCKICDIDLGANMTMGDKCPACFLTPPRLEWLRHAWRYEMLAQSLTLRFKNAPSPAMTSFIARMMLLRMDNLYEKYDCFMPVPLHPVRFISRRYNQAMLLAHELARATGKPLMLYKLRRARYTPSLGHLSRKERQKIIRNAFRVRDKSAIKGKRIILVDDVLTTGATLQECAYILRKEGAKSVASVTIARVPMLLAPHRTRRKKAKKTARNRNNPQKM